MSSNSTTPKRVRAALYFRMSKDQQVHSIERQREMVAKLIKRRGYEVVREYEEPGIPGDEIAKRPQFLKLLADAKRGLFDVIVCDDQDRFGRFDVHEYGSVVQPLREAGVRLETEAQGEIDWDDTLSQVSDVIRMAFKKEQSRDSSRRILTRFIAMAEKGEWIGRAPYGTKKDPVTKRLVEDHSPAGGGQTKAEVARWLFRTYAERDVSLGWLAVELKRRGVPAPGKKKRAKGGSEPATPAGAAQGGPVWQTMTLSCILRDRNYTGDFHWGAKPQGKYNRHAGSGRTRKTKGPSRKREALPEGEWIIKPDWHVALVDRETFEKVQAKLDGRKKRTTPQVGGGDWLLSKLMTCSHCGYYMVGIKMRDKRKYRCGGYQVHAGRFCSHNVIAEDEVLHAIAHVIERDFLNPDNLARLRAEVRRQAEAERSGSAAEAERIRARLRELAGFIKQGNINLGILPTDRLPGVVAQVREWEQERDRLAGTLARLDTGPDVAALNREIDDAEARLWKLREALTLAEPADARAMLREVVSKVELTWEPRPKKSNPDKKTMVFVHGAIYLRLDSELCTLARFPTVGS